jgi:hypothetical protein
MDGRGLGPHLELGDAQKAVAGLGPAAKHEHVATLKVGLSCSAPEELRVGVSTSYCQVHRIVGLASE